MRKVRHDKMKMCRTKRANGRYLERVQTELLIKCYLPGVLL